MTSPTSPDSASVDEKALFDQLLNWADLGDDTKWKKISQDPDARAQIVKAVARIAALPVAQGETEAAVQFVLHGKVFNLRPLVVPTVVAIFVEIAITMAPVLDSALLPWLDAVHFAEKLGEVYRSLTDAEVDVFGAVADLYVDSKRQPSISDPLKHPTTAGAEAWFARHGYQAPPNVPQILNSLVHKGALIRSEMPGPTFLYSLTFLGK